MTLGPFRLLVKCSQSVGTTKEGEFTLSNQRAGKWKTATLRDGSGMQTVTFFKVAKNLLEEYGHEDELWDNYYFEQVEEHLRSGGGLPNDSKEVGRVLGHVNT